MTKATDRHRICNYYFSTATLVSRTRLNVTFTRTLLAFSEARGPAVGPTEVSFLCSGYRSGLRRLGREADHSHEFSTDFQNECNRISSRATCVHEVHINGHTFLSSHTCFKVACNGLYDPRTLTLVGPGKGVCIKDRVYP